MSGFTYNGVHCSAYKVDYIPNAEDRWFADPEFDVYSTDVSWKNGGYYYGSSVKVRNMTLKCYFEEITIAEREDIRKWLHRKTSGRLVFDDKPFVYWNVRPAKVTPGAIYNDLGKYSGTFTITFLAEDPFGYLTRKANNGEDDGGEDYSNLIDQSQMPAAPTTSDVTFQVYNPGTEECGMSMKLVGTCDHPIEFLNETNRTRCIIRELPSNNLILEIDGDTGNFRVRLNDAATTYDNGFAYHDRGIVRLDPLMNSIRIMEQNDNGGWTAPSTLNLSRIEVDYRPRIL